MILLILIIRRKAILNFMLLEDVLFFNCELTIHCWSRRYIQCFMIGSWLLQLLGYRGWFIMIVISWISLLIYIQSLITVII